MRSEAISWQGEEGLRIAALEWSPEAPPRAIIALVHGLGEHLGRYEAMASWYVERGLALLAFDLPGHGRSEGKRGHASYAQAAKEIDRLVAEARARHPGLPLILYGHSLGGALSLNWLLERRPELAGAVIGSPGLAPAAPVPAPKLALARLMARIAPSFTLPNDLDLSGLSRDPAVALAYKADPLVHGLISARLGLDLIEKGARIIEGAKEIALPILLLQGTADRLVDPGATTRFAAAAGPNVDFRRLEGWYHELHNEPERRDLYAQVLSWIDQRVAG